MRTAVLLAMLPLGVFGPAWMPSMPVPKPKAVTVTATPPAITRAAREIPLDTATFRVRWLSLGEDLIPVRVMTTRIVRPEETTPKLDPVPPASELPRTRSVRYHVGTPHRRGGDICTRHKMRKVMVGRYKWRCRR